MITKPHSTLQSRIELTDSPPTCSLVDAPINTHHYSTAGSWGPGSISPLTSVLLTFVLYSSSNALTKRKRNSYSKASLANQPSTVCMHLVRSGTGLSRTFRPVPPTNVQSSANNFRFVDCSGNDVLVVGVIATIVHVLK